MSSEATRPAVNGDPGREDPDSLVIDCDRCTLRGIGCGDCVVTVLLGGPPFGVELDDVERRAIDLLADAGLVPPLRMVTPEDGEAGPALRRMGRI